MEVVPETAPVIAQMLTSRTAEVFASVAAELLFYILYEHKCLLQWLS